MARRVEVSCVRLRASAGAEGEGVAMKCGTPLKRSPIRRGTKGLKRTGSLSRRTRLAPMSAKRKCVTVKRSK
jgi:hypothetical protein